MVLEISNRGNGVCNEDYKHLKLERQTFEWMIFQDHNMLHSKDNKCSANIVIISLDSLSQILLESVWNFYLQDKFMAFSLSFFALLKDLNKLYFCPAFQHFLLWPEPQLLNAILNLALWSWKLGWNYSIIHFEAGAFVSCLRHPCDQLGYEAICGLREQKCGLIFVAELTLALFLAE